MLTPAVWKWRLPGKMWVDVKLIPMADQDVFTGHVYQWDSSLAVFSCNGDSMEETVAKLEEYLKNHETLRNFLEEAIPPPKTSWERL